MKFLPFVFKHLRATWVRTASTVVSMGLCVFLFCTLQTVLAHFDTFIAGRSPRRLVTRNARSLMSSLPLTLDWSAWYAISSFAVLGFFAALSVAAFHTSLGGKPLFGKALLDD